MDNRAKWLGVTAMLAVAACATQPGKLTIRSAGAPLTAQVKPVSARVADGRSQFALGNVALALESFRRAVREEPGNIDAITGVAACYDRMGRYDISRKYYEAALAVEPGNVNVLAAFAASLNLQGKDDEEAGVQGEIDQRLKGTLTTASPTAVAQSGPSQSTVPLADVENIPFGGDDEQIRPSPATATIKTEVQVSALQRAPVPVSDTKPPSVGAIQSVLPTAPARSVTITLPPPRIAPPPTANNAIAPTPARLPTPTARTRGRTEAGPRLVRTSMAEVTLVTSGTAPPHRNWVVRKVELGSVRFVSLRHGTPGVPVRVLNAARIDRLAASTRSLMFRHGWRNVSIGNAAAVRARSIVLYPANARLVARRLAAQLGFPSARRDGMGGVTLLLGSDAAAAVRSRAAV